MGSIISVTTDPSRQARSACQASDTLFHTISDLTNRKSADPSSRTQEQKQYLLWLAILSRSFDPATRLVAKHPEANPETYEGGCDKFML